MKNLFIPILSLISLCGCNKQISQPIVDYSTNYEDNRRMLNMSSTIERHNQKRNEETIVLINNKEYTFDEFMKLTKKNKVKVKKVTKDKTEIEQFNYPYEKIKTLIIAVRS